MMRNLLPWIGLLVILSASSLSMVETGNAPRERNTVLARLDRNRVYGQTFVVEQDELVAIRVLLFPPRDAHTDPVTLRVHYPDEYVPDLAYATLSVDKLATQGMTTFRFEALHLPRVRDGTSLMLQFTIEAPTLKVGNGITVIGGPDTYPEGRLYVNGNAYDEVDLAFEPVYRKRWFDRVFPISQMAAGKPGILGWPPFYALLAYAYVYVLLRVVARVWHYLGQIV